MLSAAKTHMKSLERCQNKALRKILNKPIYTPIRDLYEQTSTSSIKERVKKLSKNWFQKALQSQHHPITTNNYEYDLLRDKHETVYNILSNIYIDLQLTFMSLCFICFICYLC